MSKIHKKQLIKTPLSDWEMDIWPYEMYRKHHQEFLEIEKEYRSIQEKCPSAIMARWYWLERHGAVKIRNYLGSLEPIINQRYPLYSNMFNKFTEWQAMEEKRLGVVPPRWTDVVNDEKNKTSITEKFYEERVDFNEPLPVPLLPSDTKDELDSFVKEATANF